MKNNPFRSNAISKRTDTQNCRAVSLHPSLLKQRRKRAWGEGNGMERSPWREGHKMCWDIRMMGGGGGLVGCWIFCSDIAGLAPSELDIKSPCQVLPTLKDTWQKEESQLWDYTHYAHQRRCVCVCVSISAYWCIFKKWPARLEQEQITWKNLSLGRSECLKILT